MHLLHQQTPLDLSGSCGGGDNYLISWGPLGHHWSSFLPKGTSVTVNTKHVHVMFNQQTVSSLQTLGTEMRTSSQKIVVSQRTLF